MRTLMKTALAALAAAFLPTAASAATLTFEGVAPAGSAAALPGAYVEGGFTVTPTSAVSVYDLALGVFNPGLSSDFLQISSGSTLTIAAEDGGAFDLTSLTAGAYIPAVAADVTLAYTTMGGASGLLTLSALTVASTATVSLTDLTSVVLGTSGLAVLDDIVLSPVAVPVPAVGILFGVAVAGGLAARRRGPALTLG